MKTRVYADIESASYFDFNDKLTWEVDGSGCLYIINSRQEIMAAFPHYVWKAVLYINE